jgi:hypothetical protein
LFQRWPDLQDVFDHQKPYSWQCLYQIRLQFGTDLRQLLAGMSRRFHKQEEISNSELSDFGKMTQECEYGYAFMVNELMSIAHSDDV